MIAADENHLAQLSKIEQAIQHVAGIATLIDQVAQENQLIAGMGGDGVQNGVERVDAAVNVAYRDQPGNVRWHESVAEVKVASQVRRFPSMVAPLANASRSQLHAPRRRRLAEPRRWFPAALANLVQGFAAWHADLDAQLAGFGRQGRDFRVEHAVDPGRGNDDAGLAGLFEHLDIEIGTGRDPA